MYLSSKIFLSLRHKKNVIYSKLVNNPFKITCLRYVFFPLSAVKLLLHELADYKRLIREGGSRMLIILEQSCVENPLC